MASPYDISPRDVAALETMPLPYVRAWLQGAQKRYLAKRRFYGEILAAILWLGGTRVNPEDLYPTKSTDEKIEEFMQKWSKK